MNLDHDPNRRLMTMMLVALIFPVIAIGVKRTRERAEELIAAGKVRSSIDRKPNIKRKREGIEEELKEIDDATFIRMFRMNKHTFFGLHDRCARMIKVPSVKSSRMACLSSGSEVTSLLLFTGNFINIYSRNPLICSLQSHIHTLLAATIRWLAGGSMWDISFMLKTSYKTIHASKFNVIKSINYVLRHNIKFPRSNAGLTVLAEGFAAIASGTGRAIPGVVAAVDSVCIQRKAPWARMQKGTSTYTTSIGQAFNRKGYFATSVLAFVDSQLRFLSISMSCYTSSHDSTLFSASKIGKCIADGQLDSKWLIVGDDAFVCRGNIITPYVKHSLSSQQRNYNYFLSLNRQVVERAFGLWKWKWGIFWRTLDINEDNIKCVIEVTARLHNLCIDSKNSDNLDDFICHDDIFWQRTSAFRKPSTFALPDFEERQLLPDYADAETVAAHTGVALNAATERSTRQRVCQHICDLGLVAPSGSSSKRADRTHGINPGQQVPFATRAIGAVTH
jgi:hypothetical protein